MEWYELDSSGSGQEPVQGYSSCEHDNETSVFLKMLGISGAAERLTASQ
jgi:hypothetical protein